MKIMNRNVGSSVAIAVAAVLLLSGLLTTVGCGKAEETTEVTTVETTQETTVETTDEPAFLLVQSSKSFTYDGNRFTVHGTSPTTTFFSDRPERIAGHMSLEQAYAWGQSGDDSFAVNPPNAALSTLGKGEIANVVLTLHNSVVEGDTISWDVDVLEGELPSAGGPNTLFIDVLGRPLTPVSVAGSRRRTRRRSLAVGVAVGAAVAGDSEGDAYATDVTYDSSVEDQLLELQNMLDQGLISQEDYDREKDEVLRDM